MIHELSDLFPDPCVRVLTGPVSDNAIDCLSEQEAMAVSHAAPKRKREFATARALAREGLARFFSIKEFDLLNGKDRAPIWPHGVSGSLSHSSTRAWVALVEADRGTVGIDGENRERLQRDLWRLTMREEEATYLNGLKTSIQEHRALVIFSAKEALFKAQYPWSRLHVNFKAIQVCLDEGGTFKGIFRKDIAPFRKGFIAKGRWFCEEEVVTTVSIPNP